MVIATVSNVNESAATFGWLAQTLGLQGPSPSGPIAAAWTHIRENMLHVASGGQAILQQQDWVSDPWIARHSRATLLGTLAPLWSPPDHIAAWPDLGVRDVIAFSPQKGQATNHRAFLDALTAAPSSAPDDGSASQRFLEIKGAIARHADTHMRQIEHARAWLGTAVGHLLMSVALTPPDPIDALTQLTLARIDLPRRFTLPDTYINQFEDRHLEVLYNARMQPDGRVWISTPHVGQGEEWREHWNWLSQDLGAAETLEALQLAARLMRCLPLVRGLQAAVESGDEYMVTMSVGVVRRWLLTLKTMVWLEAALAASWSSVRPCDLACFAFAATKPEWPRRVLAISHRSADSKKTLIEMQLWQQGRCAIDANYAPAWETNTGMVWSLFASTPAIARIRSPLYTQSTWCLREIEIVTYLAEQSDFLDARWILDVDVSDLKTLDAVTAAWDPDAPAPSSPTMFRQFPPLCYVWTPTAMPAWEVRMLRAAAALRVISVFASNVDLANKLALLLQAGTELPPPAPTNNPDGWAAYARIFREAWPDGVPTERELAVRLPDDYGAEDLEIDRELAQRIPDLSGGNVPLGDVLVALEWLRYEWPALVNERRGNLVALNLRDVTRTQWETNDDLSLHRGLAIFRLSGPLWILQLAGQDVDDWRFLGEHPIFTEHLATQFSWMMEIFPERGEAQRTYAKESRIVLAPALRERCEGERAEP